MADNVVAPVFEKAIGWDEKKEGGSVMTYGTERLMEDVGLLHHVDTPSEKASRAAAPQIMQDEERGTPPANPINPIAPDPFATPGPLVVPQGIPRPPGL
jgi:hypothetical protein